MDWLQRQGQRVIAFKRKSDKPEETVIVVWNMTPRIAQQLSTWRACDGRMEEILNSDDLKYGGSGAVNQSVKAEGATQSHGQPGQFHFIICHHWQWWCLNFE